mmetsp:Transcript_10703/g.25956  ORF Transcript_10703/g.25956 Transcript_10703/m.25956 type:complete len:84 (-) Transcript_10703:3832-4083(-)
MAESREEAYRAASDRSVAAAAAGATGKDETAPGLDVQLFDTVQAAQERDEDVHTYGKAHQWTNADASMVDFSRLSLSLSPLSE